MKPKFIFLLFIVAVMVPFCFSNWGLTESSEARYAEISREMYISGDYLHPKLLGIQHFHKPPVTYYITAAGYSIFGVNEYGARFFLQIALLLQVWLVFLIAQLLYKNRALSLAAALIYFSYPVVQIAAKNLTTDAYLTAFIFAGIFFFLKYHTTHRKKLYLYLLYASCGLAFLTKGPVGVLPQLFFALFYLRAMKIKMRFGLHEALALLLFLLICFSWFGALLLEDKGFLDYFINYQLVSRVKGDAFNRAKPIWYYFEVVPALTLPAFLYFIAYCFGGKFKKANWYSLSSALTIPLIIMFIIFSASSSKLIFYVMPLFLFVCILSAKYLTELSAKGLKIFEIISVVFAFLFFGGIIAAGFINIPFHVPVATAVPLAACSLGALLFIYTRSSFKIPYLKAPVLNAVTIALLMLVLPFLMKANETAINSVKPIVQYVNAHSINRKGNIVVYNYLLPSLAFYTDKNIITLSNGYWLSVRETMFEKEKSGPHAYFNLKAAADTGYKKLAVSEPGFFIISRKKDPVPDSLSFLTGAQTGTLIDDKWLISHSEK